jgi:hypothetical protein
MQKSLIGLVCLAGVLIGAATLAADDRPSDRSQSMDSARARAILLTSGTVSVDEPLAFEAPPPAPGIEGTAPPGPAPQMALPEMAMPPMAQPLPPSMQPVPQAGPAAAGGPPIVMTPGIELYPRVKYHDRRHIAPCAVSMVVAVRDPCASRDPCCGPPKCVLVEICVPPCGCPKICTKHNGAKVRYDYGKYAVNITSRHGIIVVDYDG